jgi:hypothetical protein
MKQNINPRNIILTFLGFYLPLETIETIKHEIYYDMVKRDADFIKVIQKYFDFSIILKEPKHEEDIFIYNYLMYETRRSKHLNPFKIGDKIDFVGNLPKKGLILKYQKFLESLPKNSN